MSVILILIVVALVLIAFEIILPGGIPESLQDCVSLLLQFWQILTTESGWQSLSFLAQQY